MVEIHVFREMKFQYKPCTSESEEEKKCEIQNGLYFAKLDKLWCRANFETKKIIVLDWIIHKYSSI